MEKPIFDSFKQSCCKNFSASVTNLIASPTTIYEADENIEKVFSLSEAPNNIMLTVDASLCVTRAGRRICGLREALLMTKDRCRPIFCPAGDNTAAALKALAEFCGYNRIGDASLCFPYAQRKKLKKALGLMPRFRGILDCEDETIASDKLLDAAYTGMESGATVLILPKRLCTRETSSRCRSISYMYSSEAKKPMKR